MPSFYSSMPRTTKEPRSRFYPPQGFDTTNQPAIPSAPTPSATQPSPNRPAPTSQPSFPEPPLMEQSYPEQPQMPTNPNRQTPQIPIENRIQTVPERQSTPRQRVGEMPYFEGRYPLMLKRLYDAARTLMDTYSSNEFIYDAYPDYLSLRLMRDRLLRENPDLTEEFLQAGCPIMWLELLTDTITSELLCRKRHQQANH